MITIRITGYRMGTSAIRVQNKLLKQRRRILLDDNFAFEIQSSAKTPIFMRVPRVTVNTTMLTTLIWIYRIHHPKSGLVTLLTTFLGSRKRSVLSALKTKAHQDLQYVLQHIALSKTYCRFNLRAPSFEIILFHDPSFERQIN